LKKKKIHPLNPTLFFFLKKKKKFQKTNVLPKEIFTKTWKNMGGQASLLKFLLSSRTDVLNFSDPSCKQVLSTIPQLQMNFPPALMNPVILNFFFSFLSFVSFFFF